MLTPYDVCRFQYARVLKGCLEEPDTMFEAGHHPIYMWELKAYMKHELCVTVNKSKLNQYGDAYALHSFNRMFGLKAAPVFVGVSAEKMNFIIFIGEFETLFAEVLVRVAMTSGTVAGPHKDQL